MQRPVSRVLEVRLLLTAFRGVWKFPLPNLPSLLNPPARSALPNLPIPVPSPPLPHPPGPDYWDQGKLRLGRYASCGQAGGLSCDRLQLQNFTFASCACSRTSFCSSSCSCLVSCDISSLIFCAFWRLISWSSCCAFRTLCSCF